MADHIISRIAHSPVIKVALMPIVDVIGLLQLVHLRDLVPQLVRARTIALVRVIAHVIVKDLTGDLKSSIVTACACWTSAAGELCWDLPNNPSLLNVEVGILIHKLELPRAPLALLGALTSAHKLSFKHQPMLQLPPNQVLLV